MALIAAAVLHAAAALAQQPDPGRLRRPGERPAQVQDAREGVDTDAEVRIRRDTGRALGRRIDADERADPGMTVPNRRLNNRVLGRINTRLSTRITGATVGDPVPGDAAASDGVRGTAASPR